MVSENSLYAVYVLGFVFSVVLFGSPVCIFKNIYNNGSVQEYLFLPYPPMLLNCFTWLLYGRVQDSRFVVGINSIGVAFQCIFVAMYIWFSTGMVRAKAVFQLGVASLAGGVVAALGFGHVAHTPPEVVFGRAGVFTAFFMYGGPLYALKQVMETGSVEYLSPYVSAAALANSVTWTAYAFMLEPHDLYIAIPNVFGVLCALVQLGMYVYYTYIKGGAGNADEGN